MTRDKELAEQFRGAVLLFEAHPEAEHWPRNWRAVAQACAAAAGRAGMAQEREAAYCYLCHEIDFPFTEHMRREFVHYIEALPAYG